MSEQVLGLIGVAIAALFGFLGMLLGKRSESKKTQKAAIKHADSAIADTAVDVDILQTAVSEILIEVDEKKDEIESIDSRDELADKFNSAIK